MEPDFHGFQIETDQPAYTLTGDALAGPEADSGK
jgi:hypothetical protein